MGADHPLREPARQVIAAVHEQNLDARTTVEVIQEFTHVRSRRPTRPDADPAFSEVPGLRFIDLASGDLDDLVA